MVARAQAHQTVETVIEDAVTGALEAGVPATTIRACVARAIRCQAGESAKSGDELLEELRHSIDRIKEVS